MEQHGYLVKLFVQVNISVRVDICGKILPKDIDTPPALFVSGATTAVVVVVVKMEVDSGASV